MHQVQLSERQQLLRDARLKEFKRRYAKQDKLRRNGGINAWKEAVQMLGLAILGYVSIVVTFAAF